MGLKSLWAHSLALQPTYLPQSYFHRSLLCWENARTQQKDTRIEKRNLLIGMSRAASNPVVLHRFPPSIRSSKLLHSIPRKPFRFQSRNRHFPTLFCCQTNPKPVDSSTKVSSFAFFFCCFDGFFFCFFSLDWGS